jgi:hypothetical protein
MIKSEIDPNLWEKWQRFRSEFPLSGVQHFLKSIVPCRLKFSVEDRIWFKTPFSIKEAFWSDDDYNYIIQVGPDMYPEIPEYLGKFTDEGQFPETLKRNNRFCQVGEYKRYQPYIPILEVAKQSNKQGFSKATAYQMAVDQAKEDLLHLERYDFNWYYVGMLVRCISKITNVEMSSDSIWGLESDMSDKDLESFAFDCMTEARVSAMKKDPQRLLKLL